MTEKNTIFVGRVGIGKTRALQELMLKEKEDFKVIYSECDEYERVFGCLEGEGYEVIKIKATQLETVVDIDIEQKKVLYIVNDLFEDNLDVTLMNKLLNNIYEQTKHKQVKVRLYIDNCLPFLLQGEKIYPICIVDDFVVYATLFKINAVPNQILSQFKIVEIKQRGVHREMELPISNG